MMRRTYSTRTACRVLAAVAAFCALLGTAIGYTERTDVAAQLHAVEVAR
nr:hypothetical protein [Mycobacterium eburneum]